MKAMFVRKAYSLENLKSFDIEDKYLSNVVIEEVINLTPEEYKDFSENLLSGYDFIAKNVDLMYMDKGVYHCIAVRPEGSLSGILVESEGYNYARYSAFVEDFTDFSLWKNLNKAIGADYIITDTLVDQIMAIRDGSVCNMLDTNCVQVEADKQSFHDLVILIEDNKDAYIKYIFKGDRG